MKNWKSYTFFLTVFCLIASAAISQSFQSSNLPIVVISTHSLTIGNEPKIEADMGIIFNGPGIRNNVTDPPNNYNGKIGIEIRGSSSQMFPKKQYGIELRSPTGQDSAVSLLGMPPEQDWILSALYNDKSLMRDVLAYKIGRDLGRYAPRTRYCEVVLNGNYMGVYALIEKIKRDKNRVDISKLDPDEISGDDLTGGYIIKIDKFDGNSGPGWDSPYTPPMRGGSQTIKFQYDYPKYDKIVSQQKQYIQKYIGEFEYALFSEKFKDPVQGYAKYIDVDSFVDFFIVNEVSKNVDGYRLSTFMYKQKDSEGGKLFLGPIWDFNLSFGNANYCTSGTTDGFVIYFNGICPNDYFLIPFWWNKLFADEVFREKVNNRWLSLRSDKLKTATLHAYVDSVASVLNAEAQQRNFQRWPILGKYVWPNYYYGPTFQSEVDWLKNWITNRMDWLDRNIAKLSTEPEPSSYIFITPLPNPFTNYVEFEYRLPQAGSIEIQFFDGFGRKIDTTSANYDKKGIYRQEAGMNLASGLYYYVASFNGKRISGGKIVKR